jgi:hypothetical protein
MRGVKGFNSGIRAEGVIDCNFFKSSGIEKDNRLDSLLCKSSSS